MKILEQLREKLAANLEARATALGDMERSAEAEGDLTAEQEAAFDAARARVVELDEERGGLEERIAELEAIDARTKQVAAMPAVHFTPRQDPTDILDDRSATRTQLADALTRSVEGHVTDEQLGQVRSLAKRHSGDRAWVRNLILRSTDVYAEAWSKVVTGRSFELNEEERAAIAVGTSTQGGALVPTYLDPTVIVTNSGASNVIRGLARVVSLTQGNIWHGVTSAGATASWDGEVVEVSDDSPSFTAPSIPTYKAQAFIQASVEAFEDISNLAGDVASMLADARDRLEAAAHATGAGSTEPTGIFTAIGSSQQIVSTTAAAIGLVDLDAVYVGLPVRWRGRSTWLLNPKWALAVKDLGTAISASFSGDLTQAPSGMLLGRPVVESDEAPNAVTTTVKDAEICLGDFSNFVVVDKPGSTAIEFIPQLFNTSNNLPDGRKGWYMHWRNGSDSVNDAAFRVLVDKTSA